MKQPRRFVSLIFVFLAGCTGTSTIHPSESIQPSPTQTPARIEVTLSPTAMPTPLLTESAQMIASPTADPGMNDLDNYYGGLVITLDYAGDTLTILNKQAFILHLGDRFAWTVTVEPPERLSLNRNITPEPGEQGVYVARNKGEAVLIAIGEPVCRQHNPPCTHPNVLFQMKVDIQ